eukprot:EG_transcript_22527
MAPGAAGLLLLLLAVPGLSALAPGKPVIHMPKDLACSACWLVARQYSALMSKTAENEETIQTGHRLDRDNKIRRKKWKESELRAYEVTEQLCDKSQFSGYDIEEHDGKKFFSKTAPARTFNDEGYPPKFEVASTLHNWCSEIRGEFEEDIEKLVQKEARAKDFRKLICKKLTRACKTLDNPFPNKTTTPSAPSPVSPDPGATQAPAATDPAPAEGAPPAEEAGAAQSEL